MRSVSGCFLAVLVLTFASSTAPAEPVNCAGCHETQHAPLTASVHRSLRCQECHGGPESFSLTDDQRAPFNQPPGNRPAFDHGDGFLGKPTRERIPNLCGDCHADVARMNPYGIRTDQLAAYWTSVHGKTLKEKSDARIAVCIDCHGSHDVMKSAEVTSKTNPFNVPDTCATCHADEALMADYGLSVEIIDEYKRSVHGDMLLNRGDSGAPTCATCHGNHGAVPPGFATVGSVCGQCHPGAAENFSSSIHADQPAFNGCIRCHGGGPDAHHHLIERITKPTGVLIERYAHLIKTEARPTPEQVAEALHADPKQIMNRVLPGCLDCHENLESDESLKKFLPLLDKISSAEHEYVKTAAELDRVGRGVLLVENERFLFEDARTHLIALAPLQHTLDPDKVAKKVAELNEVCREVTDNLAQLESGLSARYRALIPIWLFVVVFSGVLYAKYKALRKQHVVPLPTDHKD